MAGLRGGGAEAGGGARQARGQAGRHGRVHARQPARAALDRLRSDAPGGDLLLGLQHVLARAS